MSVLGFDHPCDGCDGDNCEGCENLPRWEEYLRDGDPFGGVDPTESVWNRMAPDDDPYSGFGPFQDEYHGSEQEYDDFMRDVGWED
jgi:hypothetical protein